MIFKIPRNRGFYFISLDKLIFNVKPIKSLQINVTNFGDEKVTEIKNS